MATILLRSNKKFPFKVYRGQPTVEDLLAELEAVYQFLDKNEVDLVKQLEAKLQNMEARLGTLEA